MKAIVYGKYGSPDVLELRDVSKPEVKNGELLVRVGAAAVNPGDWFYLRGEPYIMRLAVGLFTPRNGVLGRAVAGQVQEAGSNVTRFRSGDEVFAEISKGGFAEYAIVSEDALALKPASLTYEQAAAVPLVGVTALKGLRDHGKVKPGQRVLINGASGGVGTFAVQIAKAFGAEVTGVCSTTNADLVRSIGADHVIDYTHEDFTQGGPRYDLILDNVGNHSVLECRRALTPHGTLLPNSGAGGRWMGDNRRMQFASEFEWLSPDGHSLLTSYMPNHYGAGWVTHGAASLAAAEQAACQQFRELAPVAATRNVLLPVGADHVIPSCWATGIHRDWNSRYVWPRFVTAVPSEFFAAVRKDAAERDVWITPQTRDMNPVYTGKDVSFIDTKQAQRAAETAVLDGERLATLAWLAGAEYPAAALDKAWRLLVFGAHHDAITGTEGDQVYLDLLAGWREAYERGDAARREAAALLGRPGRRRRSRRGGPAGADPAVTDPAGRAVVVFNTLSRPRSGLARVALDFPDPGVRRTVLRDDAGGEVPSLAEGVVRHEDGSLARLTLTFRADDVPALGYRTYLAGRRRTRRTRRTRRRLVPADGTVIENGVFLVEADPARGGTLTRVLDRRSGTDLLAGPGNELVVQEEYDRHPRWGEGPWLLSPKGPGRGSAGLAARVRAERCPIGARLVAELVLDDLRVTQETLLWDGADRVEFRTHVDGSIGKDRLLRVRFPARVPGGRPVARRPSR